MAIKMNGGKCGCTFCKTGFTGPGTKDFWWGLRNKYGRRFGVGKGYMRGKRSKKVKG